MLNERILSVLCSVVFFVSLWFSPAFLCGQEASSVVPARRPAAASHARANGDDVTGWDAVPAILARIVPPQFADREFKVTDFGAVGNGDTDCKPAFDKAIAACSEAGGGRVVVSAGEWFVRGPIHLRSNVDLHVDKDATVRFSTDPADFMPVVLTRFESNEAM